MADLLDIAPTPRVVKTSKGQDVNVYGMSVEGLAFIIKKHPQLFEAFDETGKTQIGMEQIIEMGVDVLADFLVYGLGYSQKDPDYDKAFAICKRMNPEDAWNIGQAILEESFPGGAENFFVRVAEAAKSANILKAAPQTTLTS